MRYLAFVLLLPVAGCLWSSEVNTGVRLYNGPSATVDVEVDSARSLSGAGYFWEYVYPNTRDSVQDIIVNGTLVWSASPYFIDSLAPYHLNGERNTVTIVWPHVSKTDTESISDTGFRILSPSPGDSIIRSNGLTLTYAALHGAWGKYVELADGLDSLEFSLDSTGTLVIRNTSLMKLHGSLLRIRLNAYTNQFDFDPQNFYSTWVFSDISNEYPLK